MLLRPLLVSMITGGLSLGILAAADRVYVGVAPPAAVVERPGAPPAAGYVWTPGYYNWNGSAYVWSPGRYQRPPHPHARFEAGRWHHHNGQWYFTQGHWR